MERSAAAEQNAQKGNIYINATPIIPMPLFPWRSWHTCLQPIPIPIHHVSNM